MFVKKGSTDVSIWVRVIDSSDGTPETGVAHNTAGVDLWYQRNRDTKDSITEAPLASVNSSHTDGGFIHVGNGIARLDLPDDACATGADSVIVGGTFTDMIVVPYLIQLVDFDPVDGTRMGMTALPNAAADAAGGLPISDAGGLDLDTMDSNVSDILTDTGTTLQAELDGIQADTEDIQSRLPAALVSGRMSSDAVAISGSTTAADNVEANIGNLDASIAGLNNISAADVNAQCDAALADYDAPTNTEMIAAFTEIKGATWAAGTDTLEHIRNKQTDIEADTQDLQTQIGTDGAGLTNIPWNSSWDAEVQSEVEDALGNTAIGSLSMDLVSLIEDTYQMTNNKMTVNESTGAVALRNIGDTANIATGSVTSSSGTTTRAELSWV